MNKIARLIIMIALFMPFVMTAQINLNKSFSGIKKIKMNTSSGDCRVSKSTGSNVTVNLKHTYDESRYTPSIEQQGDQLIIKEVFKSGNNKGESTWTLTLPDGVDLAVNSGSGDIEVGDLHLNLTSSTGSGDLHFTNVKGKISGTTGSGDVELNNFNGTLQANTGSGDIKVANSKGDISLNCGSGDLSLSDSQASIAVNTGSGSIDGRNITINGKSSFNTGSGNAEIVLASTPTFDLSINSGSGDAILNFNGNEIKGEIVMRASKQYGDIIAPFPFDKTEELEEGGSNNTTIQKTVLRGNGTNRISIGTGSGNAVIKK